MQSGVDGCLADPVAAAPETMVTLDAVVECKKAVVRVDVLIPLKGFGDVKVSDKVLH